MGKSKTRRVAVYLRISIDQTGERLAVDRQREDCLKLAERRGWEVVGEYVDNSVSASKKNVTRPAYNRLIRDYEAGIFDALICWDLDRLTRQPRQLEDWIDRAETSGLVVVTANGEADLGTDAGRLFARIKASVARSEVERTSTRRKRANLQAAQAGRPTKTGRRPFGFTRDYEQVPAEAALIRDAYRQAISGVSLLAIARGWNAAGTTTTSGNPWRAPSVRDVLTAGRNAAQSEYLGEVVAQGQWEPIVDVDTWRAAKALLTDPARKVSPDPGTRYLLGNIAVCGRCGARMVSSRNRQGNRAYKCGALWHVAADAETVDEVVAAVCVRRLSLPDVGDLLQPEDRANVAVLRDRAEVLRARMDEAAALFAAGTITGTQLSRITKDVETESQRVERDLAEASKRSVVAQFVTAEDVAALWDGLDILVKRDVVRALFESVTITPPGRGRRTSADNVVLEWRRGDD
ncbi:MAG: recombinase family protein [Actinomyces sp.]|jgi:DNA invertase Pin-like site-specific DNA recombinase|nr:recombinase family protein [Actinomyces sp.]MCI1788623.1 recombinase family protein [Actinomyces sp.]MCI1829725.1 recombinase family protein [Actinomyces sp.]